MGFTWVNPLASTLTISDTVYQELEEKIDTMYNLTCMPGAKRYTPANTIVQITSQIEAGSNILHLSGSMSSIAIGALIYRIWGYPFPSSTSVVSINYELGTITASQNATSSFSGPLLYVSQRAYPRRMTRIKITPDDVSMTSLQIDAIYSWRYDAENSCKPYCAGVCSAYCPANYADNSSYFNPVNTSYNSPVK